MTPDPRLDRQLRIRDWNQQALEKGRIAVFGDNDLLASLYVLSAAALGLNDIVLVAPSWDRPLLDLARRVNPKLRLALLEGLYTHPALDEILGPCAAIVDLSRYALANKLLLERSLRLDVPLIRGFCRTGNGRDGLAIFAYRRGREWQELWDLVSRSNLPSDHVDDRVLDLVAAGVALEETTNVLMGRAVSQSVIRYSRPSVPTRWPDRRIGIVGAGALGNFVGLGLALAGARSVTVIDPDTVDVTNLNRQVLLADGIGRRKAEVLCDRLRVLFGIRADAHVAYLRRTTEFVAYDVIFDCVDNFETRIILSEKCRDEGKILISGGTGPDAGQVIVFDPARGGGAPAEIMGLREIVEQRAIEEYQRETASCTYQPEPSLVMTNQIIGGLMVDACRILLDGGEPRNIFYNSRSDVRISA